MQTHHIYYLMPEEKRSTVTEVNKKISKQECKIANKNVNKKENKNEDEKNAAHTDETERMSCRIGEYTITAVTLDASSLALEKLSDENKERQGQQPDGIVRRRKKLSAGKSKRFRELFGRNFWRIVKLFAGNRVREKMFRHFHLHDSVKGKEIVVVSEKLQKILPRHMWYENMTEDFPKGLYEAFAVESLAYIINHAGVSNHIQTTFNLAVILPQGGVTQELLEEILSCAEEMNELIFYSFDEDEKEWLEDKLDDFLEETGVAGMCYQMMDDRWENPFQKSDEMEKAEECMILMDFADRPVKELWGIGYYIDADGKKTNKELRRLTGRKTHVKALRSYLDSTLSLRYNNLA